MTVIAASGCISQIDDALQNLLASCAAWQDWTGTADADAARGHISQKGIAADGDEPTFSAAELVNLRPAAIFFADEESAYIFNWSAEAGFIGGGSASFILQDNIPAHLADDIPGADRIWRGKRRDSGNQPAVYEIEIPNPQPKKAIKSIGVESGHRAAGPFVLAITLGETFLTGGGARATTPGTPGESPFQRAARELQERKAEEKAKRERRQAEEARRRREGLGK